MGWGAVEQFNNLIPKTLRTLNAFSLKTLWKINWCKNLTEFFIQTLDCTIYGINSLYLTLGNFGTLTPLTALLMVLTHCLGNLWIIYIQCLIIYRI